MALAISLISPVNSVLGTAQSWLHGAKIRDTEVDAPPIFILGHWRSGTTFLHELMIRDPRMAYPTTFACFAPHHCILTEWFFSTFCGFLLPGKRPMDNVATGWMRPQEDEFALMILGARSPYRQMAFPNRWPAVDLEFLNLTATADGTPRRDIRRWQAALRWFFQMLTYRYQGRRLILKSPPHTGRLALLAEMFPGAKFIHIARHPDSIFASTRRLWPSLNEVQGLQIPQNEHLDEYIYSCFERMYATFERDVASLPANQFCDLRYEDLVARPIEELQRVYGQLELGDFGPVSEALQAFVGDQRDYRTNRHDFDPQVQRDLRQRWAWYFQRYEYE